MPRRGQKCRLTLAARFWANVTEADGCWIWKGQTNDWGYGVLHVRPKTLKAHRISYEIHFGPIPAGLFVLHRCDNPPCVNPHHLFLGDHAKNMEDMVSKGRHPSARDPSIRCGTRNGKARLTDQSVLLAFRLRDERGMSIAAIARELGVSENTIGDVLRGKTWTHVRGSAKEGIVVSDYRVNAPKGDIP